MKKRIIDKDLLDKYSDTTPVSPFPLEITPNKTFYKQDDIKILKQLKIKWMLKKLVEKLKSLTPNNLRQSDHFHQEWEKKTEKEQEQSPSNKQILLKKSDIQFGIFQLTLLILNIFLFWYLSIMTVFQSQSGKSLILGLWFTQILIHAALELNTVKINKQKVIDNRAKLIKQYLGTQAIKESILIFTIIITYFFDTNNMITVCLSSIQLIYLFYKINQKIDSIKPFIDDKEIKKYFVLISSFFYLIAVGHIFVILLYNIQGLILYSSSYIQIEKSWLMQKNLLDQTITTKYIYSIYYAFTTIVTVGYGDITPQNKYEVVIVIFIEIFGSAMNAYIINIIGLTLHELKKSNQKIQQQLKIANKISKYFMLKADLAYRLRMFLKHNQKAGTSYTLEEQKIILNKLDPHLKNQILNQTNTKVLKKCIFFLTFFSKALQDKIALKLVKNLFQPNQIVHKAGSLYIIDQGEVDIMICMVNKNKKIYKKVKTISQNGMKDDIKSNVYGYTEMITGKNIKLSAVSKTFTIAYQLKKNDLLEAIQSHPSDFQMFYQLKDRFHSKFILESIQAAELTNHKYHYYPNFLLTVKKLNRNRYQPRKSIRRQAKKVKQALLLQKAYQEMTDDIIDFDVQQCSSNLNALMEKKSGSKELQFNLNRMNSRRGSNPLKANLLTNQSLKKKISTTDDPDINSQESYKNALYVQVNNRTLKQQQQQFQFEGMKSYINYFKEANYETILKKFKQKRKTLKKKKRMYYSQK